MNRDEMYQFLITHTAEKSAEILGVSLKRITALRKEFKIARSVFADRKPTSTLCWHCKKATNGNLCPWVRDFEPVPGWSAIDTVLQYRGGGTSYTYTSVSVRSCPLFDEDERDPAYKLRAVVPIKTTAKLHHTSREEIARHRKGD